MDKEELRKLAEAATPGPVCYGPMALEDGAPPIEDHDTIIDSLAMSVRKGEGSFWGVYIWCDEKPAPVIAHTGNGPTSEANAAFIASANPTTIIALMDEIAAKDAEIERLREIICRFV